MRGRRRVRYRLRRSADGQRPEHAGSRGAVQGEERPDPRNGVGVDGPARWRQAAVVRPGPLSDADRIRPSVITHLLCREARILEECLKLRGRDDLSPGLSTLILI